MDYGKYFTRVSWITSESLSNFSRENYFFPKKKKIIRIRVSQLGTNFSGKQKIRYLCLKYVSKQTLNSKKESHLLPVIWNFWTRHRTLHEILKLDINSETYKNKATILITCISKCVHDPRYTKLRGLLIPKAYF